VWIGSAKLAAGYSAESGARIDVHDYNRNQFKPSVKEELREIAAAKKLKEAETPKREEPQFPAKPKDTPPPAHKQPPRGKNSKKPKGR